MGIPILTMAGYEADDILGTVAKRSQAKGLEVSVVSGDNMLQLADVHLKSEFPRQTGKEPRYNYLSGGCKAGYQVTPQDAV